MPWHLEIACGCVDECRHPDSDSCPCIDECGCEGAGEVLADNGDLVWFSVEGCTGVPVAVRAADGAIGLTEQRVPLGLAPFPDGEYCIANNAVAPEDGDTTERWMVQRDIDEVLSEAFGARYVTMEQQRVAVRADKTLTVAQRRAALAELVEQLTPKWFAARRGPDPNKPRTGGSSYAVMSGALGRIAPREGRYATFIARDWAVACGREKNRNTVHMRRGRVWEGALIASYLAACPNIVAKDTGINWIAADKQRFASPDALLYDRTMREDAAPAWVRAEAAAWQQEHPGAPPIDWCRGVLECKTAPDNQDMRDTYFAQVYAEMEATGAWWADLAKLQIGASRMRIYRVWRSPRTMRVLQVAYERVRAELELHNGTVWKTPKDVPWPAGTLDEWTRLWRSCGGFSEKWHTEVPYIGKPLVDYYTGARSDASVVSAELRATCTDPAAERAAAQRDFEETIARVVKRHRDTIDAVDGDLAAGVAELPAYETELDAALRAVKRYRRTVRGGEAQGV